MRPIVDALRTEGHDVEVTARDFAQTLGLLERFSMAHTVIGRHRGERLAAKALGLTSRSAALTMWALGRRRAAGSAFDLALGHGSNDISVASALLRIPSSTMFDYEWASAQHHLNCRLASAVVVPDAIPPERLARYGARHKIRAYEGLKEEYYLADFEPREQVLDELGLDRTRPIVTVRTPPDVSLYHRFENPLFAEVLSRLARMAASVGVQPVVLARTEAQRARLAQVPGLTVPTGAIDAQSLIAYSVAVISAGGTMNREAVALGVPVYTTFHGRLGALDERLISQGRMRLLQDAATLELPEAPRPAAHERLRRDPQILVDLLLSALDGPNRGPRESGARSAAERSDQLS
jgi:hypothetical protein